MKPEISQSRADPESGLPVPLSMAEVAYRAIQDWLVRLDIRPGAPISEEELCARLGLGRTPIREALKRLEHEKLVVAYPRRGTFAAEINVTDLTHICEVRELIEPAAAASAARHATAADRAAFQELTDVLAADALPGERPQDLMTLDLRVHRTVYAATHNPYFRDTLLRYGNLATRIWCVFLDRLDGMAAHVADHRELLRALVEADASEAARVARRHVTDFDKAIRAVI